MRRERKEVNKSLGKYLALACVFVCLVVCGRSVFSRGFARNTRRPGAKQTIYPYACYLCTPDNKVRARTKPRCIIPTIRSCTSESRPSNNVSPPHSHPFLTEHTLISLFQCMTKISQTAKLKTGSSFYAGS